VLRVTDEIRIERLTGAEASARGLIPQVDAIFFGAAARTYPPGPERDAFRERWLGRFLLAPEDPLLLAISPTGDVAGYLVGTLENASESPRFRDMPHFREEFSAACREYPAHLHINLAPQFRGRGLGARLVQSFSDIVGAAGLPGLHVTTGQGMRNVGFYLDNGFSQIAAWKREAGVMLFLGRRAGRDPSLAPKIEAAP
jgi:GNAT superfamily N-acetyltransferase